MVQGSPPGSAPRAFGNGPGPGGPGGPAPRYIKMFRFNRFRTAFGPINSGHKKARAPFGPLSRIPSIHVCPSDSRKFYSAKTGDRFVVHPMMPSVAKPISGKIYILSYAAGAPEPTLQQPVGFAHDSGGILKIEANSAVNPGNNAMTPRSSTSTLHTSDFHYKLERPRPILHGQ